MDIQYTRRFGWNQHDTHRMYMITPRDHMSHDLSYFSGPSTSGAEWTNRYRKKKANRTKWRWKTVKQEQVNMQTHSDNVGVGDRTHYAWNSTDSNQAYSIKTSTRVSSLKHRLTNIIWSVTGGLEGLVQRCLLRKTKVGQFKCCVTLLGGVQQIFRLQSARQKDFQYDAFS